jgi:hypothetical protein
MSFREIFRPSQLMDIAKVKQGELKMCLDVNRNSTRV